MSDSLHRLIRILFLLPRAPQSMDTETLSAILDGEGLGTSVRTLQRDLMKLEGMNLGIEFVGPLRPYRWRYSAATAPRLLPAPDPQQALALRLVERHLERALPRETLKALRPQLQAAKKVLEGKPVARWLDRVRIVSRNQPLLPPVTDGAVVGALHEALLENTQVQVSYRVKSGELRELRLHPLGLIHRDTVAYLAANAFDYDDVRLYLVHRMTQVELLAAKVRTPAGFDLDRYIDGGELGWKLGGPIKLELAVGAGAASFLEDTPLSEDQVITRDKKGATGTARVTATVADTRVLRSFLLGFGSGLEVKRPASLRKAIAKEAAALAQLYVPAAVKRPPSQRPSRARSE